MNIYVSNLDQKVTNEQLTALFAQFGAVTSAEIVTDVFTEQSRGFAYVEMPDETEAQAAISRLNLSELENRQLTVEAAKPKETHKGSYPVGNGNYKSFGPILKRGARSKKGSRR